MTAWAGSVQGPYPAGNPVAQPVLDRVFDAAERFGAQSVGIAGGVSANARLRNDFALRAARLRLNRCPIREHERAFVRIDS